MYIWLATTPDEYELPIAIADSASELAHLMGTTKNTIMLRKMHNSTGWYNKFKVFMVIVNNSEDV